MESKKVHTYKKLFSSGFSKEELEEIIKIF